MGTVSASNYFASFLDTEYLQGLVDRVVGALQSANRRGDEAANNASSVSTFLRRVAFVP